MRHLRTVGFALSLIGMISVSAAQDAQPSQRQRNIDAARQIDQQNLARYKDNADVLVLPGLVADRKAKSVRLWAEATALHPDDPLEFFLIPTNSGKDYEALAVTFAKPSDVHRALEFIGMKPGRPVNYAEHRYWPKGERVLVTFEWDEPPPANAPPGAKAVPRKVRAETLTLDLRTGKPLPTDGLVFVGSFWKQSERRGEKPVYAADVSASKSIASNYNEPTTVLDLPYQGRQSDVYSFLKPNPAYRFTAGQMMQVVMEPEHKDGRVRVMDVTLTGELIAGRRGLTAQDARLTLTEQGGKALVEGQGLVEVLAAFVKLTEAGRDPFVTVRLDDRLSVQAARQIYAVLRSVEGPRGIRIEAPPPERLYHEAYFPDEAWRERGKRYRSPWELRLALAEDGMTVRAELTQISEDWEGPEKPAFIETRHPVQAPGDVARALDRHDPRRISGLLVFVDSPQMTVAKLHEYVAPVMKTHDLIYVFLPRP